MTGQSGSGNLNYYEQLGVGADASAEEIRDAYRALARLLHPDQQTDPQLKAVAEQQMRRLNPVYQTLADPERRRIYDEDLADGDFQPAIIVEAPGPYRPPHRGRRLVWVVAVAAAAAALVWVLPNTTISNPFSSGSEYEAHSVPVVMPTQQSEQNAIPDAATAKELARLRSDVKTLTAERDFAMRELLRIKGTEAPSKQGTNAATNPALASTLTELPQARSTNSSRPNLAGVWLYVRPAASPRNDLPDFIETTIAERNGAVSGSYRAHRENTGRGSSDVSFTFTGTPVGTTLTCPWSGQGGARGELTLRLLSDNSVRIDWAASEPGSQPGFTAGSAVLNRRSE